MVKTHLNFFKFLTLTYQQELKIIKESHLTLVEYYTLQTLNFSEQMIPRELADKFALSKSALTYVLDSMEGKGLIGRKRDKNDRRSYFVYLTDKGKKTVKDIILDKEAAILISALDELPSQEKDYLNRFFESLSDRLEKHLET